MSVYHREYCEETETGKRVGGVITINRNEMVADLILFNDFFEVERSEFIGFICGDCRYVTFHHPFVTSPGSRSGAGGAVACHQNIIANTSIVGSEKWRPEFDVTSIRFSVRSLEFKLVDYIGDRQYAKSSRGILSDQIIYIESSGLKISVGRTGRFGWLDVSQNVGRSVLIEIKQPMKFHEFYAKVELIVSFLSLLVSDAIVLENITVQSNIERDEMATKYFDVHYVEFYNTENFQDPASAFYDVANSNVRYDIEERMKKWIENEPKWSNAYHLMLEYFRGKRRIAEDRLVLVSRWLEAIPTASAMSSISDQDFDAIKDDTSKFIVEHSGGRITKGRILGSLKNLQNEDHSERFDRIIKELRARFPDFAAPEDMVSDLRRAMHMRGTAAHARVLKQDYRNLESLQLSISALECLCYLLMAAMFPPSPHVDENILRSISVQSYLFCSMRTQRQ